MNEEDKNILKELREEVEPHLIKGLNKLFKIGGNNQSIINKIFQFLKDTFPKEITKFQNMTQIASFVQDFIYDISQEYIQINKKENLSCREIESILQVFENLIMRCLYKKIMNIIGYDNKYQKLIKTFSFLNLSDFVKDISYKDKLTFSKKIYSFIDIKEKQTPYDKLICINNLCNFILSKYGEKDFQKILLFCIISCQIEDLKTHIRYCALFRNKVLISDSEEFYLEAFYNCFEKIENFEQQFPNILDFKKEKLYKLINNYDKKEILSQIKFKYSHFEDNFFIDEKLLSLINGTNEEEDINDKSESLLDINDGFILVNEEENSIERLIRKYINIEPNKISLKEVKNIKDDFKSIVDNLKK